MSAAIPRDVWSPKSEKNRLMELLAKQNEKPKRASKRKIPPAKTPKDPSPKEPVSKASVPKATSGIRDRQFVNPLSFLPEVVNQTQSVVAAPRRKSPRVVQQKVVLSSDDSEPELLPMPSKKSNFLTKGQGGLFDLIWFQSITGRVANNSETIGIKKFGQYIVKFFNQGTGGSF
eukprot:sb/3472030/